MAFTTTGLQTAVDDCITRRDATTGLGTMTAADAFARGYAWGLKHGAALDEAGAAAIALGTFLGTIADFNEAVDLQDAVNTTTATDAANDATRTAANAADEAAETAAAAARDAFDAP